MTIPDPVAGRNAGTPNFPSPYTPDAEVIGRGLRLLVEPGQAVELRALGKCGVVAGYFDFDHLDDMAARAVELSASGTFKGVYLTLNSVKPELLVRAPNCTAKGSDLKAAGGLTTDADIVRRRWLLIDADPQRPSDCSASAEEKAKARAKILEIRRFLAELGWPEPLLCDSGNGYHLLYRIDLPAEDNGLVKRVLLALAKKFDDGAVQVDKSVYNPARLTKLYGTLAAKGEHSAERPHRLTAILEQPDALLPVSSELLEKLASMGRRVSVTELTGQDTCVDALAVPDVNKLAAARAYLAKLEVAVTGQKGDPRTYKAARILVKDFALTKEQAWPLLVEFNRRCQPPWTEAKLRRKLELADAKPGPRGGKLKRLASATAWPASASGGETTPPVAPAGPPFPVAVPDFILGDDKLMRPTAPEDVKDAKGRRKRPRLFNWPWLYDVGRLLVFTGRMNKFVEADLLWAMLAWGPRTSPESWPQNWRGVLNKGLRGEWRVPDGHCPDGCPLRAFQEAHLHRAWLMQEKYLGAAWQFAVGQDETGVVRFDFNNTLSREEAEERKAELKERYQDLKDEATSKYYYTREGEEQAMAPVREAERAYKAVRPGSRKVAGVRPVYMLGRIFGPSPKVGLTPSQRNLLDALTRELTRTNLKTDRVDKAQMVPAGSARRSSKELPVPVCPFLKQGEWVVFGGNGKDKGKRARRHGDGYKLATWAKRAAYPEADEYSHIRADLAALAVPFGLVVAAYDPKSSRWLTLDQLLRLPRTKDGKDLLKRCLLRVYTRSDYLRRWRAYFAQKLGFSSIPGGEQEVTAPAKVTSVRTAADLRAWMLQETLTDAKLAALLGVCRAAVTHYRSGRRKWRAEVQVKLDTLVKGRQV